MDQTVLVQENRGSDTDDSISIGAQPMGYLRIMAQQGLQQTDYPVYEGMYYFWRVGDYILCIYITLRWGYYPLERCVS